MEDTYLTIAQKSEGLYKEKGSKFFAFAFPISTKSHAKEILDDLRKTYHDARHVCFAYIINPSHIETRANDDGEPSGTAGKPILGVLQSKNLKNVMIAVVRYFGGTKLGTSGLINAYRTASQDAIEQNTIIERRIERNIHISFDYLVLNDVMKIVKEESPTIVNQLFDSVCTMELLIRIRDYEKLYDKLSKVDSLTIKGEE